MGKIQDREPELYIYYIIIYNTSKEIQKSNFRQYGELKSRGGKNQRKKKRSKKIQKKESIKRKKIKKYEKIVELRYIINF